MSRWWRRSWCKSTSPPTCRLGLSSRNLSREGVGAVRSPTLGVVVWEAIVMMGCRWNDLHETHAQVPLIYTTVESFRRDTPGPR